MKRFFAVSIMIAMIGGILSGCGFWMDGHYESVTPYQGQSVHVEKAVIELTSVSRIENALVQLVEDGTENANISLTRFNTSTLHFYVETAIRHVMTENPIGAYAVENIDYEIGLNSGKAVIALEIEYRHDGSDILRLGHVVQMGEAADIIYSALADCESSVAFFVDEYVETDFTQMVTDYASANPDIVMEVPNVNATVYPENGDNRIVEVVFTYTTGLEDLKLMQEKVAPIFTAVQLYVQEENQLREKYAQIYTFLMERFDYTVKSSVTPAYSVLHEGVGDCKAFATVFASMCRKAKLECWVVTGNRNGIPWTWNLIYFGGGYYHVDLLRSLETGGFAATRSTAMEGYDWDRSAYPSK